MFDYLHLLEIVNGPVRYINLSKPHLCLGKYEVFAGEIAAAAEFSIRL